MALPSSHPLRLWSFERRWLARVIEDLVTEARGPLLRRYLDDLLHHAPLEFVLGLRLCLWLLLLSPPFVLGRFATYFGLRQHERLRLHARLRESPRYVVREIPLLFKMVGCLGHCGLPDVQARLGIEPRDLEPPGWAA